jgi:hypothetical protein
MLVKKLRVARERKRELTGECEGRKSTAEVAPEVVQRIPEDYTSPIRDSSGPS